MASDDYAGTSTAYDSASSCQAPPAGFGYLVDRRDMDLSATPPTSTPSTDEVVTNKAQATNIFCTKEFTWTVSSASASLCFV